MARRSRHHRMSIPGYRENRPDPTERARQHRRVRHATHQVLASVVDPEEVDPLPEVRRTRPDEDVAVVPDADRRRFRVWKTKFWKRRSDYAAMKAALDAGWERVTRPEEEEW